MFNFSSSKDPIKRDDSSSFDEQADQSQSSDFAVGSENSRDEAAGEGKAGQIAFDPNQAAKQRHGSTRKAVPRVMGKNIKPKEEKKKGPQPARFAKKNQNGEMIKVEPKRSTSNDVEFAFNTNESSPHEEEEDVPFFLEAAEQEEKKSLKDADAEKFISRINQLQQEITQVGSQISNAKAILKKAQNTTAEETARSSYETLQKKLLSQLDMALEMAQYAPGYLRTRSETSKTELPALSTKKSEFETKLSALQLQQTQNQQEIEHERLKNSNAIQSVRRIVDIHKTQLSQLQASYESKLDTLTAPYKQQLDELQQEKEENDTKIEELRRELEAREERAQEIQQEIITQEALITTATSQLAADAQQLQNAEKQIQFEEAQAASKIKELEAPYQSLLDAVDKRQNEILKLQDKLKKTTVEIQEAIKDSQQCDTTAQIVEKLCDSHSHTKEKRVVTLQKYLEAEQKYQQFSRDMNPRANEQVQLQHIVNKATELIEQLNAKCAQLETDKKAAVASKNFIAAKQVTLQLKEAQEQIVTQQTTKDNAEKVIAEIESQCSAASSELHKYKDQLESAKYMYLNNDYSYFESVIAILDGLFVTSPFGARLLTPLQNLIVAALPNLESPPKLDPRSIRQKVASLNQQLDQAVADEDFELAATLQEQIDNLNSKLAL